MIRAQCRNVSVLDYSLGLGHTDAFTVGASGVVTMNPPRTEEWGAATAISERLSRDDGKSGN